MCGRYYVNDTFEKEVRKLLREINAELRAESISGIEAFREATGHDVYPGSRAIVLKADDGGGAISSEMTWGFLGQKKRLLINARAETALEKPTFSESLLHRRCIIPAIRFYEWDPDKVKVTFYLKNDAMLYFAGFYKRFEDGERFIILTTAANTSMERTHDRMPVILGKEEILPWLTDDAAINRYLKKDMPELLHEQDYEQERLF